MLQPRSFEILRRFLLEGATWAVRETVENAEIGITHARGILQHRVEDRLQIAGRTGDDLEHLAGGGLLLECIGQLARACLRLLKKTGVLDSDHRMVGEGAEKRDLPFGKKAGQRPQYCNCPYGTTLLHIGTAATLRKPMTLAPRPIAYSGSACTSG